MPQDEESQKLIDLLYDEELSDEQRRRAEELLEDDDLRAEVSGHEELLAEIRRQLDEDRPSVGSETHQTIVDYAAKNRSVSTTSATEGGDDDAEGASGDVVHVSFTSKAAAVAAALLAGLGGLLYVVTQSGSPVRQSASKREAGAQPTSSETKRVRADQKKAREKSEAVGSNDKKARAKTAAPDVSIPPDTGSVGVGALAKEQQTDANPVGTGTKMAQTKREPARRSKTADDKQPEIQDSIESSSGEQARLGQTEPDPAAPEGDSADAPENRRIRAHEEAAEPSSDRGGAAGGGVQLFPDDGTSRVETESAGKRDESSNSDDSEQSTTTGNAKKKDQSDELTARASRMFRLLRENKPAETLDVANSLLDDAESRTTDVAPENGPTRSAHYYALEYKLRALIDLKRWPTARSTLAVLRENYPDAPQGRIDPLAGEIPPASPPATTSEE